MSGFPSSSNVELNVYSIMIRIRDRIKLKLLKNIPGPKSPKYAFSVYHLIGVPRRIGRR